METLLRYLQRFVPAWRQTLFCAVLIFVAVGKFATANAACRQALAIGLDISGSVDAAEYRLQLDGLAGALSDPEVQAAFLAMPDANVRLYVFEWAGMASQRVLVPWTPITKLSDLQSITLILQSTQRLALEPSTALGTAMLFGANAVSTQNECWRRTIDLSGDGESNSGPRPQIARQAPLLADVTVNALVVGADAPPYSDTTQSEIAALSSYFTAQVIHGPDAFVETAIEFAGFQDAMARKLLKELQTRAVGSVFVAP